MLENTMAEEDDMQVIGNYSAGDTWRALAIARERYLDRTCHRRTNGVVTVDVVVTMLSDDKPPGTMSQFRGVKPDLVVLAVAPQSRSVFIEEPRYSRRLVQTGSNPLRADTLRDAVLEAGS